MTRRRYPEPSPAPRHFVSPRANDTKRDRRRDQYVYVDDLRSGDIIYDDAGEATVISVSDSDPRGYRNVEVEINGGRKTFRYYGESTVPIKRHGETREAHVVADFNELSDLIEHAATVDGATHVSGTGTNTRLYFPCPDRGYYVATVWQKEGYWHAQGPSSRSIIAQLPRNAMYLPGDTETDRRVRSPNEARYVADFNTLNDLLEHARGEGATHYLQIDDETHIYFQRRDGRYEKAEAWQKDGYWHTQAPGSRAVVPKPPSNARPIGANATRLVRDYEAIDSRDRVIAGPFKHYGDAAQAAGSAGVVRFVPAKGHRAPPRASEAGGREFEVVGPDGRSLAPIMAPTIERAQDNLARGKNAGRYPRGARIKGGLYEAEKIAKRFRVGSRVMMSPDALENYGERWQGIGFIVTHVATSRNDHPGYDSSSGSALYDLKIELTGEQFNNSLYDWELVPEPPSMKPRRREPMRESTRSAHNPNVRRRR